MALDSSIVNGTGPVTDANPLPVRLTSSLSNEVAFSHDGTALDSFERLRVSDSRIVFEQTFGAQTPTLATTIWEVGTTGAGTTEALTTNLYGVQLIAPVTSLAGRWVQSINHIRYAPGVSTLFRFTFNTGIVPANARHRVGMFTDQGTFPSTAGDGFYFESSANALAFVRRSMTQGAGAEERVLQANWNKDKLDGTGASGYNLDVTKAQHLVVEYQWLGVGTLRFGFDTGTGGVVWAHEMVSVNSLAESWSRTGSLPVRAEIYNFGASSINQLTLINCCVIQEGDVAFKRGWKYFGAIASTPKIGGLTAATFYPVMGLRAAGTNDLTKRAAIRPVSVTITVAVVATGPTALQVGLMMLATPNTGATYAVTTGGSVAVVDIAATATTAVTGTLLWATVIPNVAGSYTFDLSNWSDNANVIGTAASGTQAITGPGNLTLAVGPVQTATVGASIVAALNWKELV
jgi:hypothetical protein